MSRRRIEFAAAATSSSRSAARLAACRLQLQSATRVRGGDGGRAVPGETRVGIERGDARAGRDRVGEVRRRRREGQRDAETVAGETGQTHTRRRRRRRRRRRSLRARGLDGDANVGTLTDVLRLVLVLVEVQVVVVFVLKTNAERFGVVPSDSKNAPAPKNDDASGKDSARSAANPPGHAAAATDDTDAGEKHEPSRESPPNAPVRISRSTARAAPSSSWSSSWSSSRSRSVSPSLERSLAAADSATRRAASAFFLRPAPRRASVFDAIQSVRLPARRRPPPA